jgi:hypothetical protein
MARTDGEKHSYDMCEDQPALEVSWVDPQLLRPDDEDAGREPTDSDRLGGGNMCGGGGGC